MLETYSLTQTLALLIGLYFLAAGVGLLTNRYDVAKMFDDLKAQPMLAYLGAFLAFAIGGVIVALHNDWSGWLAGFVSLVGWAALIEGVLLLAAPGWYLNLFDGLAAKQGLMKGLAWLTLVLGAVLILAVFF